MSLLTAKTKRRSRGFGLRCGKLKPPERRDSSKANKVLAKDTIEAKTKEVLAKNSKKPRLSKTRGKSQEWWKKARRFKDIGKRIFIWLCYLYILAIICLLL